MLKVIKNVAEALKLAEHYENINEDEITETANDLWYEGVFGNIDLQNKTAIIRGGYIIRRLTGFGNIATCKLCRAVDTCDECLYKLALSYDERMEGNLEEYYCTSANVKTINGATLATTYSMISRFELKLKLAWNDKANRHEIESVENAVELRDALKIRAFQIRAIIENKDSMEA